MEIILNEDSDWDHIVEGKTLENQVNCKSRDEVA